MYLEPGNHLWVDAWIPRDDVLWSHDVSVAAEWVGRWWVEALAAVGIGPEGVGAAGEFSVHSGRSAPGALGDLVCFAGRGPGEVFVDDRKVVGVSQWRSREGALFSTCAFVSWDPEPLLDLLSCDDVTRADLSAALSHVAVGLDESSPPGNGLARVRERLVGSFPGSGVAGGS